MGNYNEIYYTDYRWIKKLPEEENKNEEDSNLDIYIPIPLFESYLLEEKLFNIKIKKANEDKENFDFSNLSYKKDKDIVYRYNSPITDKLILRKERINRNPFKIVGKKRMNVLNELKIFFYENLFQNFETDIEDLFMIKFCHHISLLHTKIIYEIEKNLVEHLNKNHNLNNEILTFSKLRNILAKDFLMCDVINLSPYTYYYVKNLTKDNFKEIIPLILIEEGDIYKIINEIITQKKINNYCLWFLLCLIYVFDTEANQKEIITTYKSINTFNPDIFKEKTLITNKEFLTTTKNKNLLQNEKNIIEINYERIINKNWYLSFKAMDTQNFSPYPKAEEVLIQPNSIFEIREIKKIKDDSYHIILYMKNNILNDCVNNNMSNQMQIDFGICVNIDQDVNKIYPGIELQKVISLTITSKESLKNNLTNIACMQNLRILDLKNIDLDDNDMEEILPFLMLLTNLSYLNLSRNNLEQDSMISFESIMKYIPYLEYINLNQNNLCDKGTDFFTKGLNNIRDLRSLNFIYNHIKSKSIEKLCLELSKFENLKMLNFSNNYISSEQISNLIWSINQMNHLTYLNLSSNQIGNEGIILLTNNLPSSIQRLNLSENEITEEGIIYFSNYLNKLPNLLSFAIYGNKNGTIGLSNLLKGFKETPYLESLNLGSTFISNQDLNLITQNFENIKNLQILNLRENNINSEGIIFLNDNINRLEKLTTLDLGWNDINEDSLKSLIDTLKLMKNFISFHLDSNPITVIGLNKVINELKKFDNSWNYNKGEIRRNPKYLTKEIIGENYILQNKNLSNDVLILNGIGIYEDELLNDIQNLKNYSNIKNLIFTRQELSEKIIKSISDNLKSIPKLLNIELGENNLNDEGIIILSEGIKNLVNLETLDLKSNNIKSNGMKSLSNILKYLTKLKVLNLNYNKISDDGLISLSKINLSSLEIILLKDNNIEVKGMKEFSKNLKNFSKLIHIDLSLNNIGDDGLNDFILYMNNLKNLKFLLLSNNDISDDSFINFVKNLDKINNLESLFLWDNIIGDKGAEEFLNNLKKYPNLKHIDLTINDITVDIKNKFKEFSHKNKGLFIDI